MSVVAPGNPFRNRWRERNACVSQAALFFGRDYFT
jgi:hypothetical protein